MSESSQLVVALVALTTRAIPAPVRPMSAREARALLRTTSTDLLLDASAAEIARALQNEPADAQRVEELLARRAQVAGLLESWEHEGTWVMTDASPGYPESLSSRLGDQAPVVLYGVGSQATLATAGLGVVGSRNLSPEAEQTARDLGAWAARNDLTLVSGGARGADRAAGAAALAAEGCSTWITAEGVHRAVSAPWARTAIMADRLTICSPYHPDANFSAGAAMGRNKLVYALADATAVVATDMDRGGTWAGATESLKKDYGRVLVYRGPGEGPGNAELQALGATPFEDVTGLDIAALPPQPPRLPQAYPEPSWQMTLEL